MSLRCSKCGAVWPDELEAKWGQTPASDGYGSDTVCTAIVEDPRTGAGAVCRGRLRDSTAGVTHDPAHRGGRKPA